MYVVQVPHSGTQVSPAVLATMWTVTSDGGLSLPWNRPCQRMEHLIYTHIYNFIYLCVYFSVPLDPTGGGTILSFLGVPVAQVQCLAQSRC